MINTVSNIRLYGKRKYKIDARRLKWLQYDSQIYALTESPLSSQWVQR